MASFKLAKIKLNIKLLILTLFLILSSTALHTFLVETGKFASEGKPLKGQVLQAVSIPAFPGAEGFGFQTIGGRGGRIIKVTNLNNTGSGSLREAMEASGPRIVVFDVSGTITLTSRIDIEHSYLTVAGQTAPGQGIQIRGRIRLRNDVHDVVLRYLRIRSEDPGCPDPDDESDCPSASSDSLEFNGEINNVIIDHCSIAWATDENFSFYNNAGNENDMRNVIISWNIIAEGEKYPSYIEDPSGGDHSMGLLIGSRSFTEITENISIHHNLFIHNGRRNPILSHGALPDSSLETGVFRVVNNVIYNWGRLASHMRPKYGGVVRVDYINNYYRKGSDSGGYSAIVCDGAADKHYGVCEIYHSGNVVQDELDPFMSDVVPQLDSVLEANLVLEEVSNIHLDDGVTIVSAEDALDQVAQNVGVMLPANALLQRSEDTRDSVDERLINELETATGDLGIDRDGVRRYSYIPSEELPIDSDNDGMPDSWETERGLNPSVDDSAQDRDEDGYTNIEEYINCLVGDCYLEPTLIPDPSDLEGDLNDDGRVDILDLTIVSLSFGKSSGDFGYDLRADANGSGEAINIFDLIIVGRNFGLDPEDPGVDDRADLDDDGDIDIFDLAEVGNHFGEGG